MKIGDAKFDSEGRRLLPTRGLPKKLLADVMRLDWTTDDIRCACDVIDEWNGLKRGRGRPAGSRDDAAIEYMATIAKLDNLWKAETLARRALAAGYGCGASSNQADIKRLARAFRQTPIAKLKIPVGRIPKK